MNIVDYRKFRLKNITDPQWRHLLLLLYWPLFGIGFFTVERLLPLDFKPVYHPLDDLIPFCEWFVIPYYLWFVFIIGNIIYTLLLDVPTFKKYSYFVIISYTLTLIIFVLFPNKQDFRPTEFERDNILVDIVKGLYGFDTNTNVCPSLHVVGSFAVMFSLWNSKHFSTPFWRAFFAVVTVLISISTVFLRQHSVIDIITGVLLSFAVYPLAFKMKPHAVKISRKLRIKNQSQV